MEYDLVLLEAPFQVYRFGAAVALGVLICLAAQLFSRRRALDAADTLLAYAVFLPFLFLGARLCYCLVRLPLLLEWNDFGFFFRFADGGYMIHGALFFAPLAAFACGKWVKRKADAVLDDMAPALALGFAACFFGKHWIGQGRSMLSVSPWLQFSPLCAYSADYGEWLYAVALWEALFCLALYVFLRLRPFRKTGERAQALYLALSCGLLFFSSVEGDGALSWGFVRAPQVFSLALLLGLYAARAWRARPGVKRLLPYTLALAACVAGMVTIEFGLDMEQEIRPYLYGGMALLLTAAAFVAWKIGEKGETVKA